MSWCNITPAWMLTEDYFGDKNTQEKGKNMTEFEIKETVTQIGYVDKDGKFHAESDPSKVEQIDAGAVYVQSSEDIVE